MPRGESPERGAVKPTPAPASSPPRPEARRRRGEEGYNLVILVVAITVMSIMLAVALPSWSSVIRRDREEELIFRGFQYAEAIRCFNRRFHRYPVKLDELVETAPRSIRQLWKDPMTEDGKWRLVFQGGPGAPVRPQVEGDGTDAGATAGNTPQGKKGTPPDPGQPGPLGQDDGTGKQEIDPVGPIIGVASRSNKESFLIFNGRNHYDEWEFTVDILNGAVNNRGVGVKTGAQSLNVRWIGRPLPQDLVPPGVNQNGTVPGNGLTNSGSKSKPTPPPPPPGPTMSQ